MKDIKSIGMIIIIIIIAFLPLSCDMDSEITVKDGNINVIQKKFPAPAIVVVIKTSTYWGICFKDVEMAAEYKVYALYQKQIIPVSGNSKYHRGWAVQPSYTTYDTDVKFADFNTLHNFSYNITPECFGVCAVSYDGLYSDITWSNGIYDDWLDVPDNP